MASAVNDSSNPATSESRALRNAQLTRAVVLFVAGLVIAFTATMHGDIQFNLALLGGTLTLIAIATFVEYYALRGTLEAWWVAARAIVALGAAGTLLAVGDSASMALVVAVWAALTAVITLLRLVRGAQARRIALPSLLLSLALTIAVLLVRDDAVAVVGFFGAYAVIRGVFLAISAFDHRAPQAVHDNVDAANGTLTTDGTHDD